MDDQLSDVFDQLEQVNRHLGDEAIAYAEDLEVIVREPDQPFIFRVGGVHGALYSLTGNGDVRRMMHSEAGEVVEVFHEGARVSRQLIATSHPGLN